MKEKYSPVEPLKKGIVVAELLSNTVYKAVKPRVQLYAVRRISALRKFS